MSGSALRPREIRFMRHILSKAAAASTFAAFLSFGPALADQIAGSGYGAMLPVEHPGAPEDLSVRGFATDDGILADPPAPEGSGEDIEIQELQEAFPSTNWPPSMRK